MHRAWLMPWLGLLAAAILVAATVTISAADPPNDGGTVQAASVTPRPAPQHYALTGLKHSWQTLNNCGPASVSAALSYYGVNVSQEEARQALRPDPNSSGMGWQVIAPYVAKFGLDAKPRTGGTRDLIKSLVANDIPVIVLQVVSETNPISHFRVVTGYDDTQSVFYVNDSLLGPNVAIAYDSFDERWKKLAYSQERYIPIYRPAQAALVAAILGPDWPDVGRYVQQLASRPTPAPAAQTTSQRATVESAQSEQLRAALMTALRGMWAQGVAGWQRIDGVVRNSGVLDRTRELYRQGLEKVSGFGERLKFLLPGRPSPNH